MFFVYSRDSKKGLTLFTPAEIILGVMMLLYPATAVKTAGYIAGGLLLIKGVSGMPASYKEYGRIMPGQIFLCLLGLFVITGSDFIISLIPLIFGMFLFSAGISSVQSGFYIKNYGVGKYLPTIIFGFIKAFLAVLIFVNPFGTALTLFRFIGGRLLWDALTGMVSYIQLKAAKAADEKRKREMRSYNLNTDRGQNVDIPVVEAEIVDDNTP